MHLDYIAMGKIEGYKPRIPAHIVAVLLKEKKVV